MTWGRKADVGPPPSFATDDVEVGEGVRFGHNVRFKSKRVRIGDGCVFGNDVRIDSTEFDLGDYGTIYDSCFFPGPGNLRIGHNFWLGTASIVDCQGGTTIGDNVGVGAHSQLWTHMKFGDVMAGSRFHVAKPLEIGDDAWLVGHCLVSPVKVGARSLAMLGSLVTKDMQADRCYAGVPAADITEKVGPPFKTTTPQERHAYLQGRFAEFQAATGQKAEALIALDPGRLPGGKDELAFNVADRTYRKTGSALERRLIRFLLPDAKFVPASEGSRP